SMAFDPRYREAGSGRVLSAIYLNYTRRAPRRGRSRATTIVSTVPFEYRYGYVRLNLRRERTLLAIPQPYSNHNGGHILFGRDGMLYVGMGDGGAGGDPQGYAQNPRSLLGKILRIDPRRPPKGRPYGIPRDNPYAARPPFRPEIFALGLRNPWRMTFDRATGRMYLGDVGQSQREEV